MRRLLVTSVLWATPLQAQITRIIIDSVVSPAFRGATYGTAGAYETLAGRAFGELDPNDPRNTIMTDLRFAPRNARGKVEYQTTFFVVKPVDMRRSSGLVWHDVPNRGGRIVLSEADRQNGDIGISSGWQGDESGGTAHTPGREVLTVPRARPRTGPPITGRVLGRIFNATGPASQPLYVYVNPVPYRPRTLDTRQARLVSRVSETADGRVTGEVVVPPSDWAWARCTAEHPFPGVPDSTQICLRHGFDAGRLYQVEFTAQDPPILGIGFAAFRDVATFFRTATTDAQGTPNPLASQVRWMIGRGISQSGNFLRAFLQLGFNQGLDGKRVHDGEWVIIAGRRISLNTRFALPDGILPLYGAGSEGPQWWGPWRDTARGLPESGILDRCTRTTTCPKIVEHFGAAEVWGLKLSPEWVGTDGTRDLPLPDNVRRYYIPGTAHGGAGGGFSVQPPPPALCPSRNWGTGVLAANPLPHTETVNALRVHIRAWVMANTEPPPSVWPRISDGTLVAATKEAMGFPTLPGLPATAPTGLVNPFIDYEWGPRFDRVDGSGIVDRVPPGIRKVFPMMVPKVDADGNELGGVPLVLRDAPLGTYTGWNITASGFFAGQACSYAAGMIPFANTKAERLATGDPRLSLEERYGDHDGYVAAVRRAAERAVAMRFLTPVDAASLVEAAAASDVLRSSRSPQLP
ncbi:MAG: hypothetical protein K2R93_02085 [Gemmatimonadaceae bacterium]|nr:hypothetical protein [Gemmatimonadaceae bacterium]